MHSFIMGAGMGAVMLLTASVQAAPPVAEDGPRDARLAQADRPRGFSGFSDWDSRSGGYDRSRRQEDDRDADRDRRPGGSRQDFFGRPGPGRPGPGFEPFQRPDDSR